jgi:serine/threonine protein kinase
MNKELLRRISLEFERIEQAVARGQQIDLDNLYPDLLGQDRETALTQTRELLEELLQSKGSASPWISAASMSARYEPVKPVSQGGMGEIWVAIDHDFDRQVAIKEILPDAANDPRTRDRFLRETRITAKLEHPGILPVYSKGKHADGRPFYAMRWIAGQGSKTLHDAIHEFHSVEEHPETNQRLRFHDLLHCLVSVCKTIAFAHHAKVIHRDLKPANIMIGPFGETFVLDWGLALDLSESQASDPANAWRLTDDCFQGTPGFVAPECLDDPNAADARSDIYSLGLIIYQICIGCSPFSKSQKQTPEKMKEAIVEGGIGQLRQIDPSVHPALDAIFRKATATEPTLRYASAIELADDLSRYLSNEPTQAWPEPRRYRAARMIQRNIASVMTVAVATLLTLAGAVGYSWVTYRYNFELSKKSADLQEALRQESSQKQLAIDWAEFADNREKLANQAIDTFWREVAHHPQLRFSEDFQELKRSLLKRPLEYYQKLSESYRQNEKQSLEAMSHYVDSRLELSNLQLEGGDSESALRNVEQVSQDTDRFLKALPIIDNAWLYRRALTMKTLARIHAIRGDNEASSKFDKSFEDIANSFSTTEDLEPKLERLLIEHKIESTRKLVLQKDLPDAIEIAKDAMERSRKLCEHYPEDQQYRKLKKEVLNDSALLDLRAGDLVQAKSKLAQLLKEHESNATSREEEDYDQEHQHAATLFNLGVVAQRSRDLEEAFEHHTRALAIRESSAQRYPTVSEFQKVLGHSHLAISDLHMRRNQSKSGVESYRKWIEINRRLYAKQPDLLPQKMELASSLHQLGHFEEGFGNNKAMITIFEEALPLAVEIQQSMPNDPIWLRHRAELSEHLGTVYFNDNRFADALEQFEKAFAGIEYFATQPQATSKDRATFRAMILTMIKIAERIEDIGKIEKYQRKRSAFEAIEHIHAGHEGDFTGDKP